jgi:outer membrane lipoprotein-sorting protein
MAKLGPAILLTLVVVLAGAPARAEPPPADVPRAPSLATRAARFPALRTATAALEQEREVSLVDEVLKAQGTIALSAPASFRLDLTTPEPLTLMADGATVTVVDAAGKTLPIPSEVAGLASFARTLTDLLLGNRSPEGFSQRWRDADAVVLTPAAGAPSPFTEITLRFPPDGPLPTTIEMRERGGDRTTIRLNAIVLNPPLDPARFKAPVTAPAARSDAKGT